MDRQPLTRDEQCYLFVLANRAELWPEAEKHQRLAGGFTGAELARATERADG